MTRKHFEALALALLQSRPQNPQDPAVLPVWRNWVETVKNVADVCSDMNRNFNRDRFLQAAGMMFDKG